MKALISPLLAACTLLAGTPAPAQQAAHSPHPVGMTLKHYDDPSRRDWDDRGNRPLATLVWYPTADGTVEAPWDVDIFRAGMNAMGAPVIAGSGRLPLVIVSHGTGGAAAGMAWLAETLAAHGYLVAAVNHHGNTAAEGGTRLQGIVVAWDRPKDVSVLIDRLLADPRFGPRIDPARIGVAGFSIGGYTALASVGARLDYRQWQAYCAGRPDDSICHLPPEAKGTREDLQRLLTDDTRVKAALPHANDAYDDPRVRAAFAMSPVLGHGMTTASLRAIKAPVKIVVGTKDDQAVPADNAQIMAAAIPGARLELVPDATHYVFLPVCTFKGKLVARPICADPDGLDRQAIHEKISAEAVDFFDTTLSASEKP